MGILRIVAINRRVGFHQAAVIAATVFSFGFALNQPWLIPLIGILAAIAMLAFTLVHSPEHDFAFPVITE